MPYEARQPSKETLKWCQFTQSKVALGDERKDHTYICLSAPVQKGIFISFDTIAGYMQACILLGMMELVKR